MLTWSVADIGDVSLGGSGITTTTCLNSQVLEYSDGVFICSNNIEYRYNIGGYTWSTLSYNVTSNSLYSDYSNKNQITDWELKNNDVPEINDEPKAQNLIEYMISKITDSFK